MRLNRLVAAMVLTALCSTSAAQASPAVCNETAGGVIFKDTLYGIGIGGLLTGLGILAAQKGDGQVVAGGAFVGGVIGLGVGIADISTRDCSATQERFESRFSLAGGPGNGVGLGWSMAL
jgi:hypothetical protein